MNIIFHSQFPQHMFYIFKSGSKYSAKCEILKVINSDSYIINFFLMGM